MLPRPKMASRRSSSTARTTTADFFAMFDVPFQYGGGWAEAADDKPGAGRGAVEEDQREALRRREQRRPDGAARRTTTSGSSACSTPWRPTPKFYDLNNGASTSPRRCSCRSARRATSRCSAGNTNCWKREAINGLPGLPQLRLRLDPVLGRAAGRARRAAIPGFIDNYVARAEDAGRFERPLNNRLTHPTTSWLGQRRRRRTTTACWSGSRSRSWRCAC